ncbi:MAG TPA: oligopeptide/dipeptide ABC transporter ATP-binding protein [Actinomycetota bacterium]|nr:oligopeptide/dipeptide ABC transporter ATP-binding protein [Actinomycetota bacterium]
MTAVNTKAKQILRVEGLVKHFPVTRGILFQRQIGTVKAVDGVSFEIGEGETLGLVGESGSGKSTVARSLLRLHEPTSGSVYFEDRDIVTASRKEMAAVRREMQIVFQDPFSSLNPRMTVRSIVSEPLQIHGIFEDMGGTRYVNELLERVGLSSELAGRYPHEFSGGQRQRIGLARALALRPKLIICDEPVSALDVSVQAQIINLLEDLQNEFGLTYLFVAHDLSVVRHISDRVVVMYLGRIMEMADRLPLYETPMHPYTQALLSAVPIPDPQKERSRERIILRGDVPSPLNPPSGCVFHPRCFLAERLGAEGREETVVVGKLAPRPVPRVCVDVVPKLEEQAPGHRAACHFAQVRKVI